MEQVEQNDGAQMSSEELELSVLRDHISSIHKIIDEIPFGDQYKGDTVVRRMQSLRNHVFEMMSRLAYLEFEQRIREVEFERDCTQTAAEFELKILAITRYCRAADAAANGNFRMIKEQFGIDVEQFPGSLKIEIRHPAGIMRVINTPVAIRRALKIVRKIHLGA